MTARLLPARVNALAAGILFVALAPASAAAQTLTPPDTTASCRWMPDCSAPGTSLEMAEVSRSGSGRGTKIVVSPRVAGFPVGAPLTFWMRRIGEQPKWLVAGSALDAGGAVTCADRTQNAALAELAGDGWCSVPLDSIRLTLGGTMHGEPFEFAISTADGRQSAFAVVVPRQSVASVPACGTIESRVIDAEANAVTIAGRGFPASSSLTTESVSGKGKVPGAVTTDSTGRFIAVVTHATRGSRGGDASYIVRTESCQVTLQYPWGRSAK